MTKKEKKMTEKTEAGTSQKGISLRCRQPRKPYRQVRAGAISGSGHLAVCRPPAYSSVFLFLPPAAEVDPDPPRAKI